MVKRGRSNFLKFRQWKYRIASEPLGKGCNVKGHWVIERGPGVKQFVHPSQVGIMQLDRNEELKAMKAYRRNVTKSPETAKAFLTRIGAFEIK